MPNLMKITENHLAITSVASICGLLFIWVIPETIALRHLLLIMGCISGVGIIRINWIRFKIIDATFLPLFFIFGLFFWVLIHYLFFSLNPALEFSEIKSLWVRSLLGAIAAVGLGIALVKNSGLRKYFYLALFATPAINVSSYAWACYLKGALVQPQDFVRFVFTKIETAYFGAIAGSVASGNIICILLGRMDKSKAIQILVWLSGLALVLVSALVSNTKNGMAVALGLCVLVALVGLVNAAFNTITSKVLSVMVVALVLLLAGGVWKGHNTLASAGWATTFQDARLGIDIEGNRQWQKTEGSVPMPINDLGFPAASNTYSRFAYAAVGVKLISDYPLGYGSVNRSFAGLQEYSKMPHEHEGQVHSGWIDFGLAFGIPGLILIFSAMLSIIYFGLKSGSVIALPWVIFCLAFLPFGLIAEITWKQYFEATIFFLSLGATVIIFTDNKSKAPF